MTSQDGGYDVRPSLCAPESAGCPLARPARVTSLARSMRHSS